MQNIYKYIVLILSLLTFSCAARSIEQAQEERRGCVRALCESNMAKTFTETAADADFTTGQVYPVTGDVGPGWWDVLEASVQQGADRSQAIRKLAGVSDTNTRIISVPLVRMFDPDYDTDTTTWIRVLSAGSDYWNGPSGGDTIYFEAPSLPIGAKITSVYAYLNGNGVGTLPSPMPTLTLTRNRFGLGTDTVDTTIGTQADTTVVLAAYNLTHLITIAGLTETVTDTSSYRIELTTSGSNSNCLLHGIRIVISLP